MKKNISKNEAKKRIDEFFSQKNFNADEAKKIKRLAMKCNIKLGNNKRLFCKKCFVRLKGRLRVSKTRKTVICASCGAVNRTLIGVSKET